MAPTSNITQTHNTKPQMQGHKQRQTIGYDHNQRTVSTATQNASTSVAAMPKQMMRCKRNTTSTHDDKMILRIMIVIMTIIEFAQGNARINAFTQ